MGEQEYCDYCKELIPPDHTFRPWDDQSKPCQGCRSLAIRSKKEGGAEVYNDVVTWFSNVLGIEQGKVNSVPYLYENRRDISARVGKKFIPTKDYDPPYIYGLYVRWYSVKRLWKITHLIGIPLTIVGLVWANWLGLVGTSLILFGLSVIVVLFLLNYLLSYLFSTDANHLIVVHAYYNRDKTERIMAHEVAHFVHNYRNFFAIIHNLLDSVLFPFFTSYTEGMASWVEWEYARSKGKPAKMSEFPLVYRNGLRLFHMIEKGFGRNAVLALLKTI